MYAAKPKSKTAPAYSSQGQGAARIERIGSGDVELGDVRGTVSLGTLGSGDLDVRNAGGLNVQRTGSGSVRHAGVSGTSDLPRKR